MNAAHGDEPSGPGRAPVTLVTGASSGIGKIIALRLGRGAGHVVVSSHHAGRAQAVADEIIQAGGKASIAVADLFDATALERAVDDIVSAHGRIDHAVISGAGGSPQGNHFKLFMDMDPADFAGIVQAHWLSKALLIRLLVDRMASRGYGKIVNVSTDAGRVPTPNESMLGGAAAGLMVMSRAVAREVGRHGIRINTVSLGPLADFDMAAIVAQGNSDPGVAGERVTGKLSKRMLFPVNGGDVASMVQFLLDPTGDNITGQTLSVNGGVSTT